MPGQRWISACHEARRTILHTKHEDDYPWLNKNTKMLQSTFINSAENWLEVKLRHPFFVSFLVCLFDCFGSFFGSFILSTVLSFFGSFFLSFQQMYNPCRSVTQCPSSHVTHWSASPYGSRVLKQGPPVGPLETRP